MSTPVIIDVTIPPAQPVSVATTEAPPGSPGLSPVSYFNGFYDLDEINSGTESSLTLTPDAAFTIGTRLRIAADAANYFEAVVTGKDGTFINFTVVSVVGSGSSLTWFIGLAGDPGEPGEPGSPGSNASVTAAAVAAVIASAAEKTTPVDADQLGITDSAAGASLKRLTFANLWVWIKSKLDGALVLAGAKTFSAQVELTGQAATNGTSAMTRALGDTRYKRRVHTTPTSTQTIINNSAVFQTIMELTLPAGDWTIEAHVACRAVTNAAGHKIQISGSGFTNRFGTISFIGGGNVRGGLALDEDTGHVASLSVTNMSYGTYLVSYHCTVAASATINIQMAQAAQTAENLKIYRGAVMSATQW